MVAVEVREVTCGNCGHHWATKSQRRYTTCPQCMYKVPVLKAQATPSSGKLDTKALEGWLWNAACSIRGAVDAPKFKDYILPLIFVKRLSDVYDDEIARLTEEFGSQETALELVKRDHDLVRFYIPEGSKWDVIRKHTTGVGEKLTDAIRAIAKENPKLQGVVDIVDFNATVSGQRIIDDTRLMALLEVLSDPRYRLGLKDVEPDILGRAYEYLLRKFAEGQGSSAGEFFTPKEVGWLIAHLVDPKQGESVYDPACGSAGLLIKCELLLKGRHKELKKPLQLYAQELNHVTYAMSRMNMIIHDMEGEVTIGDTLKNPKFLDGGKLRQFDIVVANPMWNQDGYNGGFYENDPFERFGFGYPSASNADWGWLQHMYASLTPKGRAAVVLDTGAVSRGSGSEGTNKERDVRKDFVDHDLIECVILLPENLFYNTTAAGIIIIINKSKALERRNEVLLINASNDFEKGRPKNYVPDSAITKISECYAKWADVKGFSKRVSLDAIVESDYNLSPSWYVSTAGTGESKPLAEVVREVAEADKSRRKADEKLDAVLTGLGFRGWRDA
jgi:type I restriction enzyme M protein